MSGRFLYSCGFEMRIGCAGKDQQRIRKFEINQNIVPTWVKFNPMGRLRRELRKTAQLSTNHCSPVGRIAGPWMDSMRHRVELGSLKSKVIDYTRL